VVEPKVPDAGRGKNVGRRALFAGAVVLAGTAIVTESTPAAADTALLDWFNVKDFHAAGTGAGDDTAAIQAAIDAAAAVKGGTVYFPKGIYPVKPTASGPALTLTGDNIRLVGAGRKASTLTKLADGIMLRMSGQPTDSHGSLHRSYCSIENLGFNGNGLTGLILELYYNSCSYFRDIYMTSNRDMCIDAVEFWDSRFYNLVIESSTGTAGSTTQPNIWLRNSSATTGWGYSADNVNQVHFIGCRLEDFGTGALWITHGAAAKNNPNGIYLTDCKFETSAMQGGPHLKVDASCRHVYASNIYCYSGGFADGYSTAQNVIAWAASHSALENVLIASGEPLTVNSGVDLYSGGSSTSVLRNVVGAYTATPVGSHIYYESTSTGEFRVENCYGTVGIQSGGTIPTKNHQSPPLRLVAGKVTDSAFSHTPVDGTLAVDTTNKRLYVRVAGGWLSTALS
jgi:hypothetical protein